MAERKKPVEERIKHASPRLILNTSVHFDIENIGSQVPAARRQLKSTGLRQQQQHFCF